MIGPAAERQSIYKKDINSKFKERRGKIKSELRRWYRVWGEGEPGWVGGTGATARTP